jgi:dTDP-4-amino-4,6-dideoxy-D-galactose acyltransferase
MNNKFENLDWDSKFFNKKIGKIVCTRYKPDQILILLNNKFETGYDLIYIMINDTLDKEEILERYIIDRRILYKMNLISEPIKHSSKHIKRLNNGKVSNELIDLAIQSAEYSRFKYDNNFTTLEFRRLYEALIVNSVKLKIADSVFVFEMNNTIYGMATLKHGINNATINMIAVDSSQRGKNIGSMLLDAIKSYLLDIGINEVEVATQKRNLLACRFYENNNFNIKEVINYYHVWKKDYENTI